ncbi:MAG: small-conductance mechanosensitive ion channel [Chloroflexi bacterium]|nr:MAG: small-conductance mechanosensitive ion channel [Chloroflexota bacterium]
MPQVANFAQALLLSTTAALMTFLSFIPALIGALLLLVVGWLLSDVVARLVTTVLRRLGFDTVAQRTGATNFIALTGARDPSASRIMGELARWFIRLIFLELAAEALHLQAVVTLINQIVLFLPNLAVALIVIMVGALIANFVAALVSGSAGEVGFRNPNLLAWLARAAILTLAVIIALSQIGVAAAIVDTLFIGLVGAAALAVGLAFGLGGQEVAGQIWQHWYKTGQGAARQLEKRAAAGAEPEGSAAGEADPSVAGQAQPPPTPYQARHERPAG